MPAAEGIRVEIEDASVLEMLNRLQSTGVDTAPVLEDIGSTLVTNVALRMREETDPDGNPWPDLADSTILARMRARTQASTRRRRDGESGQSRRWLTTQRGTTRASAMSVLSRYQILQDTGSMAGSLNYQVDSGSVTVGFNMEYAVYHEFGAPRNNMPKRGLLMSDPEAGTLGEEDHTAVLDILNGYFQGALHG